jgi:hypothetical protein
LVEQRIENPRVPGSIPGRGTIIEALNRNVRGFFDSGVCKSLGTRWRIPADALRVAIPGRGTIIQEALYESTGLF